MLFAVWLTYPVKGARGPYLPEVVRADSYEDAVEEYSKKVPRSVGESSFIVCHVNEVVTVSRRRRMEYDTKISPYPDPVERDED